MKLFLFETTLNNQRNEFSYTLPYYWYNNQTSTNHTKSHFNKDIQKGTRNKSWCIKAFISILQVIIFLSYPPQQTFFFVNIPFFNHKNYVVLIVTANSCHMLHKKYIITYWLALQQYEQTCCFYSFVLLLETLLL